MEYTGNLRKMRSEYNEVIHYHLPVGDSEVVLNSQIGHSITLEYQNRINCIKCGRQTNKSFAQGFCYPCFTTAPETEECVLRPELCRAQEGVARDMEYATNHCLIEHVVYLSLTSGLKVGVTRNTQIPTRWIDQGAVKAIELARTPNRYLAGLLEVHLKGVLDDKTNWRKMLSGDIPEQVDLVREKSRVRDMLPDHLVTHVTSSDKVLELNYPVSQYPEKIKSLNLDKDPLVTGILKGIKGQYLIFDGNRVINIRKFGGYLVRVVTSDS